MEVITFFYNSSSSFTKFSGSFHGFQDYNERLNIVSSVERNPHEKKANYQWPLNTVVMREQNVSEYKPQQRVHKC